MQTTIITLVLNYVKEIFARFAIKSPAFFKVIQVAAGVLVLVTGSPIFLSWFSVHIPSLFGIQGNTIIGWISAGALFVALMTTQSKPAAITEEGQVLKTTDNAKLPFTQKSEEKAAEKLPDIPVIAALPTEPPPIATDHIEVK